VHRPTTISSILGDVIQQLQPLARERSISIKASLPERCDMLGDELRLRQVFLNLIDNALKFTSPGGTVQVECSCMDGQIICKILDTGSGIADEHIPHIFNRFYRADAARNNSQGGSGLGLSIAQRIVSSHGGLIEVASRQNAGTVFTVKLPSCAVA
jgi:signal transduction histidine kinase